MLIAEDYEDARCKYALFERLLTPSSSVFILDGGQLPGPITCQGYATSQDRRHDPRLHPVVGVIYAGPFVIVIIIVLVAVWDSFAFSSSRNAECQTPFERILRGSSQARNHRRSLQQRSQSRINEACHQPSLKLYGKLLSKL